VGQPGGTAPTRNESAVLW